MKHKVDNSVRPYIIKVVTGFLRDKIQSLVDCFNIHYNFYIQTIQNWKMYSPLTKVTQTFYLVINLYLPIFILDIIQQYLYDY